jgi:hypothetical protein
MMSQRRPPQDGDEGNGKTMERRSGVDRRVADHPGYAGPERRRGDRRKADRRPDKPLKR